MAHYNLIEVPMGCYSYEPYPMIWSSMNNIPFIISHSYPMKFHEQSRLADGWIPINHHKVRWIPSESHKNYHQIPITKYKIFISHIISHDFLSLASFHPSCSQCLAAVQSTSSQPSAARPAATDHRGRKRWCWRCRRWDLLAASPEWLHQCLDIRLHSYNI